MAQRAILHIDMDAFFAAVEVRDRPELRGQPVVVGGGHRGVVAAASYEARAFGVHSAMAMATALRRCPKAVRVAPRHAHYAAVSRQIFAIFARFTPLVEGLSLDEAFLDVSGCEGLFGPPAAIAAAIQAALWAELKLTAAAGVATSKFVAKVASDLDKPGGRVVVPPGAEAAFLAPLPIERMWGAGPVQAGRLRAAGITTLGELAVAPADGLERVVGRWGPAAATLARGIDPRAVICARTAQSLSVEETFAADLPLTALDPILLRQALSLAARLGAQGRWGRLVRLKLKDSTLRTHARQLQLPRPVADPDALYAAARTLLPRFAPHPGPWRLCGLGLGELAANGPPPELFTDPTATRRRTLEALRQRVDHRFGRATLTRATLLKHKN